MKIESLLVSETPGINEVRSFIIKSNRNPDIDDPNNFCNMCDHTFSSKRRYLDHLATIHTIKVPNRRRFKKRIRCPNKIPDIDDPNNFCNACDYTFSSKEYYDYHLTNTHSIKIPESCRVRKKIRYPELIPDINEPNNFCKACDRTFSSKQTYYNHLTVRHTIKVPKKTRSSKS